MIGNKEALVVGGIGQPALKTIGPLEIGSARPVKNLEKSILMFASVQFSFEIGNVCLGVASTRITGIRSQFRRKILCSIFPAVCLWASGHFFRVQRLPVEFAGKIPAPRPRDWLAIVDRYRSLGIEIEPRPRISDDITYAHAGWRSRKANVMLNKLPASGKTRDGDRLQAWPTQDKIL
ncbi:MAG: hypothetical protein KBE25_12500 [Laribacter sp.]|nr:hypothetical protein [Laribacter sp.]